MAKWKRVKSLNRRWQKNHLINKDGAVCYLCKKTFAKAQDITIDHWLPISKGGTDTIQNYRLAHEDCNRIKRDMLPEEFLDFQKGVLQYGK